MRTTLAALVASALVAGYEVSSRAQTQAAAPAGNADAGKAHYALGNTSCRNCHGGDGEGAFGPMLAGRPELTYERFRNYVRNPLGRMPSYLESELTDQEIADMVAYFTSLPKPAKPSSWRVALPKDAPRGQQLAIATIGCGQCHLPTLETPRHGMAEVGGGWEWFKRMVYDHVAAQREQWSLLDPALPRVTPSPAGPPGRNRARMGNYSTRQLPEATLKEIYDWAADLGTLAALTARMTAAPGTGNYTIDVFNTAVRNKGVAAEEVTVAVQVPENVQVVKATGGSYEGVQRAAGDAANVATWRLPKLTPGEKQTLTLTLSAPAPALRGVIRWGKPAVKADDEVAFQLAGAGRGGRGGAQ